MPHNGLVLAKESSCESFSKKKEEKRVKIKKSKTQHGIDPREYRKNFYNINFTREIWMPTNVTVSNNNENKASLLMLVQKAIIYRIDPHERFIRCGGNSCLIRLENLDRLNQGEESIRELVSKKYTRLRVTWSEKYYKLRVKSFKLETFNDSITLVMVILE